MKVNYQLLLFNDNKNSFEDVIIGLTQIAQHNTFQAENCAYIVHYKGQCVIKNGPKQNILKLCNELSSFGLKVKIQKAAE